MHARKLFVAISFLSFSMALWAQSNSGQQNIGADATTNPITIRGCVTGSAGTYVLVADQHGKPYMLEGSNSNLDKMIRHEVEVTGQLVNQTGADRSQTSSSGQTNRTQPPGATLQVSSVREISDTCSAKAAR